MDTFFEQIVPLKKTAKDYLLIALIWLVAFFVAGFLALLLIRLIVFAIAAVGFTFYGAFKLSSLFFLEYEYIVTNGTVDIDKIIAKNSRKRILSFEISGVLSIEKYNPEKKYTGNYEKTVFACNRDSKNAYVLVIDREKKGKALVIIEPNERTVEGITASLPKYIANSAFKEG